MSDDTNRTNILWVDDEIDLLKPHILFLEGKGYSVTPVSSGADALELLRPDPSKWDVVLLDENMPGLSGLELLDRFKLIAPAVPVVMVTKNEEEDIMDQAVGNLIADYLIKPVNPNQILLSLKKILHSSELVSQQASINYRKEFIDLSNLINNAANFNDWTEIYRRLTLRRKEFENSQADIVELLRSQWNEAEQGFFRFIKRDYANWFYDADNPIMSNGILNTFIQPFLERNEKTVLLLIDNLRLDQWFSVKSQFLDLFDEVSTSFYCSLLPTTTQYCRNAIFSGLLPEEIKNNFPELWIDEDDEESKNLNESPLIEKWLSRKGFAKKRMSYFKANDSAQLQKSVKDLKNCESDLSVIVINFIDILSHSRTESMIMKELTANDAAYCSIASTWFRHSPFAELLKTICDSKANLVVTSDHGSIKINKPIEIIADKNTNTSLRYKVGKNLGYPHKEVFEIKNPRLIGLPSPNLSSSYIFAKDRDFFVYPNNYNHYVNYFRDTYQHGGVSMEEMIMPITIFKSKR